jgi:hypothetical protein
MTDFSVVAIIAAYNEADLIAHVVGNLIHQGLQVYFLDDGSTDGTVAAVEPFLGRGVLAIEPLAQSTSSGAAGFDWEQILRRKAALARELDAQWFVHHDADEFRESPWSHLSLLDAIRRVDALGFNAIDFASFDFWPVDDRFRAGGDVREALTFYAEPAEYDRLQIRCWKKAPDVDLATSGGHEARFCGRKVFPIRFISRHYPIRGQAHGERKVFHERRSRFLERERAKGWHVQYDHLGEGASFIRDTAALEAYDAEAVRLGLALRHRGVEELESRLAAERSAIATLRGELDAREQDARRTADTLAQTTQRLGETEAGLAQTRAMLGASEATLAQTRDALARTDASLAQTQDVLARTQDALAQNQDTLARTQDALARSQDSLARTEGTLARTEATLERTQGTLAERTAEAAGLRAALEQRAIEIGQWRAAVDDCTRRLDAFERSFSWRWSAPARAALRLLRGD